jgi:hypothetical protein
LLALTISLVTSWVSFHQKSLEDERVMRDQLTDTLSKIYSIRTQVRQVFGPPHVDQSQAQTVASDTGGFLSQQLSYLTRQADYLASRLEGRVADIEFATIAQTDATMIDSEAAKRNWSRALDAVNALDQARRPLYRL